MVISMLIELTVTTATSSIAAAYRTPTAATATSASASATQKGIDHRRYSSGKTIVTDMIGPVP
jgi:hypothetical protein